jgi:signal peptidase II
VRDTRGRATEGIMVTDLAAEEGRTRSTDRQPPVEQVPDVTDADAWDSDSPGGARVGEPAEGALVGESPDEAPALRRSHGRALTVLAAVAVAVLALDLISKQLVVAHLSPGEPVKVLGGLFYFNLIRNGGAAFSMGTNHTYIFPLVTLAVAVWIIWMATKLRSLPWAVALGLVLGGAFGNLGDRLFRAPGPFRGHVVDFISFLSPDGRHFAIFNLADSALTCGVILAVLLELAGRRRDGSKVQN